MNKEREKKTDISTTGKRYSSVKELLEQEETSPAVVEQFSQLQSQTEVVRFLVDLRKEIGLTQTQMAEKLKVTQSAISKLESSNDDSITLLDIFKYCDVAQQRVTISFGKPMNHVEAVKYHAFAIKSHLSALAEMEGQGGDTEQSIQAFFGEAFFNILSILSKCHNEMPARSQVKIKKVGDHSRLKGERAVYSSNLQVA
jgi:transcriptional regulator with XRE-family HTH domain